MIGDSRFDCGCIMGSRIVDGQKTFVIQSCSPRCSVYLEALRQARQKAIAPEFHFGQSLAQFDGLRARK